MASGSPSTVSPHNWHTSFMSINLPHNSTRTTTLTTQERSKPAATAVGNRILSHPSIMGSHSSKCHQSTAGENNFTSNISQWKSCALRKNNKSSLAQLPSQATSEYFGTVFTQKWCDFTAIITFQARALGSNPAQAHLKIHATLLISRISSHACWPRQGACPTDVLGFVKGKFSSAFPMCSTEYTKTAVNIQNNYVGRRTWLSQEEQWDEWAFFLLIDSTSFKSQATLIIIISFPV